MRNRTVTSRQAPVFMNRTEIADGSRTIPVATLFNVPDIGAQQQEINVVAGNGAWGGPRTFSAVATRFLQAATKSGHRATFTMYKDPIIGASACREADRTERLRRVAEATAANYGYVQVLGHSWSARGAIEVASDGYGRSTEAFVGYTVTSGLHPRQSLRSQVEGTFQELRNGDSLSVQGLGSMATVGCTAFVQGMTAPRTLLHEVNAALRADLTDELIGVSQKMPAAVVLGGSDAFFGPAPEMAAHLVSSGYRGDIHILGHMTHVGAVAAAANGAYLFGASAAIARR